MKELVLLLARALVVDEGAVMVEERAADGGGTVLALQVAQSDLGRIIGKQGKTARSLRALVAAAAERRGVAAALEIVE